MDKEMAFSLAVGMMEKGDVRYQVSNSGDEVRTLIGSAAVYMKVSGEGEMLSYAFYAAFVEDIPLTDENELELYKWINEKNAHAIYARYYIYEYESDGRRFADLRVENEILAENVQQEEFINALHALWSHTDNSDDEAVTKFGGKTAEQVIKGSQPGSDSGEV